MREKCGVFQAEEEIFASTLDSFDRLPREITLEPLGYRPPKPTLAHGHAFDVLIADCGTQAAPNSLDFR